MPGSRLSYCSGATEMSEAETSDIHSRVGFRRKVSCPGLCVIYIFFMWISIAGGWCFQEPWHENCI